MKFAYADPPYLGCGKLYTKHHDEALVWDAPEAHRALIERLVAEYPDGWALSASSPSLKTILPFCPDECRVMAWVKPFASFKPGVGVAYAWEPVIVMGGRKRTREQDTVRDWCAVNITLQRGLTGAKPTAFVHWLLEVLNAEPGDTIDDLFPGSGAVQEAIVGWLESYSGDCQAGMFAEAAA
jgi:hypothetical protein